MKTFFLIAFVSIIQINGTAQSIDLKDSDKTKGFGTMPLHEAGFSPSCFMQLDTLCQGFIKDGRLPHLLVFVTRHGKIAYFKEYGWKNMEHHQKLNKDDIFRIASQTKPIVATGLMILFERGCFSLDDPVWKYIPEFKSPRVKVDPVASDDVPATRPAAGEITIRHLLSHSSGITYEIESGNSSMPIFHSMDPVTLKEFIPLIAANPLAHDPGTNWTYGLNMEVAGYLIELFSGQSLDQFLKENIFDPLGMEDTYFYLPPEKAGRLVELYTKKRGNNTWKISSDSLARSFPVSGARYYFSGGAGLVGTIEDYARFCQMILNRGEFNNQRILGRKTVELMARNQIGDATLFDSGDKFGLGFRLFSGNGTTLRGREGSAGSLEWGGMYNTLFIIDPEEDMAILLYTNTQSGDGSISVKCSNIIYSALN
jgi:CubicO group peptidase (beta-lactamase class C family)